MTYRLTAIFKDHTENVHDYTETVYRKAFNRARKTITLATEVQAMLIYSEEGTCIIIYRRNITKKKTN